ncbi:hypothetical protein WAI453_001298 [Rhynchosporium graminicola]|uniref:Uncharacterized protein n=2 Tax=Rhynchosporium TaxID=38037 RepID=A0A1E1MKU6_RHYSE|nr:uncharacterized protein RCO7_14298 [Rhynchosporium commune]CZT49709.1 uncharacterized protein RSE6_10591 [Rhynchosporium secalis]
MYGQLSGSVHPAVQVALQGGVKMAGYNLGASLDYQFLQTTFEGFLGSMKAN